MTDDISGRAAISRAFDEIEYVTSLFYIADQAINAAIEHVDDKQSRALMEESKKSIHAAYLALDGMSTYIG